MAIEPDTLRLLAMARRVDGLDLSRVATLGRYTVNADTLSRKAARSGLTIPPLGRGDWCEPLLEALGAQQITSFDASPYQGATAIADFNEPIPEQHRARYSAYLDFGSMEHVLDVRQVAHNINTLLAVGGKALILTLCNGDPAHGFYQFSPEFFYSVLHNRNGFAETRVFLIRRHRREWRFVPNPAQLGRRNAIPSRRYAIACLTTKLADCQRIVAQQSDYELGSWKRAKPRVKAKKSAAQKAINRVTAIWRRHPIRDTLQFWEQTVRFDPDTIRSWSDLTPQSPPTPALSEQHRKKTA